ncbi:Hypothetical protein CINCED_3A003501 [Cinara cedri]|uniref:Uncharacterized protein n=1 Tax=Cinara cedri TaxID=506608 RepID=A0A5E4NFB7_9HEMI|nr:Hypothetical protein CINCED_3A003501 [Cinara cedri]
MMLVENVEKRFWAVTAVFALAVTFVLPGGKRKNIGNRDGVGGYTSDRFTAVVNTGLTDSLRSFGGRSVRIGAGLNSRFDAITIEPGMDGCQTFADLPLIYSLPWAYSFGSRSTPDGDRQNPAAVSAVFAHYGVPETFAQRFFNTLTAPRTGVSIAPHKTTTKIGDPKPYESHAPVPPSLGIANGHYIIDASRPISPNTVNVGGIHLKHPGRIPNVPIANFEKIC